MIPLLNTKRVTVSMALVVPCLLSIWWLAGPDTVTTSTYAMGGALLTALAAITAVTYRNSQATGSMGQLLHETENAPSSSVPVSRVMRAVTRP
jgi:hypothetical protein